MKHEYALGDEALRSRVKPLFDRHGHHCPSSRAIGRHFADHVDFAMIPDADAYSLPEPIEVTLRRLDTDAKEMRLHDPEEVALGRNNSDYHQLAELLQRLQRRIEALDNDPTAFVNADGTHSFTKLNTWSGLIDNARKLVEGLNKMRNSDRMTISILEQHTKRFATAISKPVAQELRLIQGLLKTSSDPAVVQARAHINALLEQGVQGIMRDAAVHSLREAKEQYKLLN